MTNPFVSLRRIIAVFVFILLSGTLGYKLLEGFSWLRSFYMVVQTVSTVGFNEVGPLSNKGVWFTIVLIISSFGTFAYGAGLLAQLAMDGSVRHYLVTKRIQKRVENLSGHTIVCGLGRNGKQSVLKLQAYGTQVVVIERNEELINSFEKTDQTMLLMGDATNDEMLEQAGVGRAKNLITALSSDTDNLFVVISARQLNKDLVIGARANSESTEKKLIAAGANFTVSPNLVGGAHLAHNLMNPGVMNFLDHLSVGGSSATNIEEILVDQLPSKWSTCNIRDLEIRQETGCTVIGYVCEQGNLTINPAPDFSVEPHSKLYVLGNDAQIEKLQKWFEVNMR